MDRLFFAVGSASAFLAVALGAFGAHGLRNILAADALAIFETGVRYQMYHALALLAVGLLTAVRGSSSTLTASGWLFVIGTIIFSGSLYLLSVTGIRWLGAITPLGGVCFLVAWALLVVSALRG